MENKKGSVMFYGIMLGIVIFVLALALAPSVSYFTTGVMNETGEFGGLNCTDTEDNFVKVTCIVADLSLFYFIGALILIAGAVATARFIFGGIQDE